MPIEFQKYVDITSGIGAGVAVATRDLIGRIFTNNPLLPPLTMIEVTSAADAGTYFGFTSAEYLRAVFYFGWISKNVTSPRRLSFARWTDAAAAPRVYGVPADYPLANFTSISAGSLTITMGAFATQLTAINLSGAASLAAVAALIQTAVRAYTAGGPQFTAATVTYDATRKSFNLVGGSTGAAAMVITAGTTGTDVASRLGWLTGSIQGNGGNIETVVQTLTASAQASTNFGSFLFIPALTDADVELASEWNDLQNVMYIFCVAALAADVDDYYTLLLDHGGTAVTLSPLSGEYPEMMPMNILAATDYTRQNSVQNYMFQQAALTASVLSTIDSNSYDAKRINYYGQTQTAGRQLSFYQRGLLMGLASSPVDMNTYANEIWLKDYMGAKLMELLLALSKISANTQGRAQTMAVLQSGIDLALTNGTISVGKPLSTTQQVYIGQLTNDPLAWKQVQNIGYWLDVNIVSEVVGGATTFKIVYTLIYSKDDVVRKIEGTHVLI